MAVKDCYQNASEGMAGKFAVQVLDEQNSTSFKRAYVELLFNFSGRLQQVMRNESLLRLRSDSLSARQDNISSKAEQTRLLSVFATVNQDERLTLTLEYNRHKAHQDRIARWMQSELFSCFGEIVSSLPERPYRLTTSELPLLTLAAPGSLRYLHFRLDEHGVAQDNIESVYSCPAALHEGILLAQLKAGPNNHVYIYIDRIASRLTFSTRLGSKQDGVETDRIGDAWKAVCQAHPILRTVFISGLAKDGAFQQIILKRHEPPITVKQIPRNGPTASQVIEGSEHPPLDPMKPPHHLSLYLSPRQLWIPCWTLATQLQMQDPSTPSECRSPQATRLAAAFHRGKAGHARTMSCGCRGMKPRCSNIGSST